MLASEARTMQARHTGPCDDHHKRLRSHSPERLVEVLERQEEVISSLLEQCQAIEWEGNSLLSEDSFIEADDVTLRLQAGLEALRAAAEMNLKDQEIYLEASERAQFGRRSKPLIDTDLTAQGTPRLASSKAKGPLVPATVGSPKSSMRRPPSARPPGSGTSSPPRGGALSPARGGAASPPREGRHLNGDTAIRPRPARVGPGSTKVREVRATGFNSAGRHPRSDSPEAMQPKTRVGANGQVPRWQGTQTALPRRVNDGGRAIVASTPALMGQAPSSMPRRSSSPSAVDPATMNASRSRCRGSNSPPAPVARVSPATGNGSVNGGVGRAFRFVPRSVSPPGGSTPVMSSGPATASNAGRRTIPSRGGSPRSKGSASPAPSSQKPCYSPKTPSTPVAPQPWHSSHCPSAQSSNLQPKARDVWPATSARAGNGNSQVSASPRQVAGSPRQGIGTTAMRASAAAAATAPILQMGGSAGFRSAPPYGGPAPWLSEWPTTSFRPA
mmetsp:Transcript_45800/g.106398  ORF Transcript_45800/g.106398 Transcript_45800/m.106398 type:complete len:500 (-) Transcript_45800:88-1587(-)